MLIFSWESENDDIPCTWENQIMNRGCPSFDFLICDRHKLWRLFAFSLTVTSPSNLQLEKHVKEHHKPRRYATTALYAPAFSSCSIFPCACKLYIFSPFGRVAMWTRIALFKAVTEEAFVLFKLELARDPVEKLGQTKTLWAQLTHDNTERETSI